MIDYYHTHRQTYPEPFRLRIHRALSWLKHAENNEIMDFLHSYLDENPSMKNLRARAKYLLSLQASIPKNLDNYFINLWTAFNAAYANELEGNVALGDRANFRDFLQTICHLDKENKLYQLVWQTFSGSIRILLNNRYTFQPFWDFHNGKINENSWMESFFQAKKKAQIALAQQDTNMVLTIIFDRLYTLRNQIIHGGATFNSSANREQLQDACTILSNLIPIILNIMQQHPQHNWGNPFYPYIGEN